LDGIGSNAVLPRGHCPGARRFPHGARGYETMREVLKGGEPNQLWLANHLGIVRTVMTYLLDDLAEAGS